MSVTLKYLLGGAALLAGLLVVPALGMSFARQPAMLPAKTPHAELPATALETQSPPSETFVGVLLPAQMANLTTRETLKVLALRTKRGEHVKPGDVIVSFDLRAQRQELEIAQAQLNGALAEAAVAQTAANAAHKRLSRRGTTIDVAGTALALVSAEESAQAEFDSQTAGARSRSALAHIAEQRARVEQLELSLRESELRAPFAGVVSAINFEPGATVRAGDVVARVVGGSGLRARIAVPEESAAASGAKRALFIEDGKLFFASLDQLPTEPEPTSRMFIVEGNVDQSDAVCGDTAGGPAFAGRPVRVTLLAR